MARVADSQASDLDLIPDQVSQFVVNHILLDSRQFCKSPLTHIASGLDIHCHYFLSACKQFILQL